MSNKSKLNNSVNETEASREGLSPSRCLIGEQNGLGCHQTTADTSTT